MIFLLHILYEREVRLENGILFAIYMAAVNLESPMEKFEILCVINECLYLNAKISLPRTTFFYRKVLELLEKIYSIICIQKAGL